MIESNEIFSKLSEQQRKTMFDKLAKARGLIYCKTGKDVMIKLKVYRFEKNQMLVCERVENFQAPSQDEKLVMSFSLENEKYFFQARLQSTEDEKFWEISGDTDLFKLQRRDSFRIRIPNSIKTSAILKNTDTKQAFANGTIGDLSSGGCKVHLPGIFPVVPGQIVQFEMVIGRRPPFTVLGEIRHIKKISEPKPEQVLGVMFKDMTALLESKLFTITMELHRELIGKMQGV